MAHDSVHLARLEQSRDYQRLLARLVRLSERFQRSLSAEQRQSWLMLEDALLDHAWFLHGYYLQAGYQLGKTAARSNKQATLIQHASQAERAQHPQRAQYDSQAQRRTSGEPAGEIRSALREQAVLLSALARLLETLVNLRR